VSFEKPDFLSLVFLFKEKKKLARENLLLYDAPHKL